MPSFCQNPKHPKEKEWHTLDVRRALRFYTERVKDFRKSEALFIFTQGRNISLRVSSVTLSKWIRECIQQAYTLAGVHIPSGIQSHSVRGAATSAVFEGVVSLPEICRAATWSNEHTFLKHYKVDKWSSAAASFGRKVLQKVVKT